MSTLIRAPANDPAKSTVENLNELTLLSDIDPDLFTNTRALWHPPGARGVFGGAVIAHCLVAAQRTVPEDFTIHSMHCYFVLAGDPDIPIIYHVEHVREGRSFATRTVQARQRGKPIFTTTLSFAREGSGGKKTIEHAYTMPDVPPPIENFSEDRIFGRFTPFEQQFLVNGTKPSDHPYDNKTRMWIRARDHVSSGGGHQAHAAALAYVSDANFIGTVFRAHRLWRWPPERAAEIRANMESSIMKKLRTKSDDDIQRAQGILDMEMNMLRHGIEGVTKEDLARPAVGMMVSLDHSIYFHNQRAFRADEWMFSEMETPWTGDGRGLVFQRIWSKDGTLIATCIQEGVVRLHQPKDAKL